ncbi:MAG: gliding motility-associated C-terminal domain-containing protein [Saprospiraceae bacterium]|nr:gliding motility-associated C-terminal domain-containing protein [Saprospiraceae bacterium]
MWWPNVISANGDKINDYFNVYGKRVRIVKSLAIYDRWGEQVYKAENLLDANKGGREIGGMVASWELVMPGVYVFVADIEFEGSSGSEIYKGDFTVIR